jgi:hypothetical protein
MLCSRTFSCIKALALLALVGASLNGQQRRTQVQAQDLDHPIIRSARQAMLLPDSEFVPVVQASKDLAEAWQISKGALGFFLVHEMDPFRGVKAVQWMAHAAEPGRSDLLRAVYRAAGLEVRLTESINFVTVQDCGQPLKHISNKRAYVEDLIGKVVRLHTEDHEWQFELPSNEEFNRSEELISTRGAPALKDVETRNDRADILIINDSVYFIFYTKIAQMDGWAHEDSWFPAEARRAVLRQ